MPVYSIRGTSGAGKSTLARAVMEKYESRKALFVKGRKQPIGYLLTPPRFSFGGKKMFVLGHYEIPCGGGDTVSSREQTFNLILSACRKGYNVFMEGVVLSDEVRRTAELNARGFKVEVIGLTTDVELCIKRINSRRRQRNAQAAPVNEENTRRRTAAIDRAMARLKEAGVHTLHLSWNEAYEYLLTELCLPRGE